MIYGNATGGFGMPKTIVLEDSFGNEFVGVVTDSEVVFDATPEDVKIGKVFASSEGIEEGTDTKLYRVYFAYRVISPGKNFSIPLGEYEMYNYTQFQAMIAEFNTTQLDSTSVERVSLNDAIFNVGSNVKLSDVTKNVDTKSIDFNIINDTSNTYIIHYNLYKEE